MKSTFATKTSKEEYFVVRGTSMLPVIESGKSIHTIKTDSYKKGDIVVYKLGREYIVHRIVRLKNNIIITKGDHNLYSDKAIAKSFVIGKVYKVGNQRIDTKYWQMISPILTDISLLEYKFALTNNQTLLRTYWRLQKLKTKIVGEKSIHVYYTLHALANSPFLFCQMVMKFLKKMS
jgi:signal peptidase I